MKSIFLIFLIVFCISCKNANVSTPEVVKLNNQLAKGWNTWNTRSVMSHVLLPEAFSVNLQLKDLRTNEILKEALIGRRGKNVEQVTPGNHTYDGSYTELSVAWKDVKIKVQSASNDTMFVLIVTPLINNINYSLLIKPEILWQNEGTLNVDSSQIRFKKSDKDFTLHAINSFFTKNDSFLECTLSGKTFISSIKNADTGYLKAFVLSKDIVGDIELSQKASLSNAMQTVLAWDVIYEPVNKRVIAPVSRIWNCNWNGWVLFDWDTYFASLMLSNDNKELAYSNAIAITHEITEKGFIPNFGSGICRSEDRSQPPVGSFVIWKIYERYKEKWFLDEVFDNLVTWNRWWEKNRDINGYLCWGSDPYNISNIPAWLSGEIGKKQAAMWESGLDNSPMYDNAVFDTIKHRLMLADVGLISMYIWDCKNLALIANELGKSDIKKELEQRADKYSRSLKSLWDEKTGIYLNKDLITGALSKKLSPTNFYPLLSEVPSQAQAERMIKEHFYNPEEFWGEWIIPSISRNDSAFKDNTYWRGRIWAPMNFLVYVGMLNYDLSEAQNDLKEKSAALLLKSWNSERHIYENYNSVTGVGDDVENSDKFYHWGALLGYISLMDNINLKK